MMSREAEYSDSDVLDLLRQRGPMTVSQLVAAMEVTATAVRQRLVRMVARGDVERQTERRDRGRPVHRYGLTEKGRKRAGANFGDLAMVLWQELREVRDPEVRRGLMQRLGHRLAGLYESRIAGSTIEERMNSLAADFSGRQIPFDVDRSRDLPVLHARACPYPELAEQDRGVCAMEKMMLSELVGQPLHLASCRLDGHNCCSFEPIATVEQASPLVR
jgi:predicted ArsR family transcriptional regulator